jgi:hypothetical protein
MKRTKQLLLTNLFIALVLSNAADAMPISDYDRMSGIEQTEFINFLVEGSYKTLCFQNKNDQAEKLLKLFKDKGKKGGSAQLEKNLAIVRKVNEKNYNDVNYKDALFDVEAVMALTMDNNGISVLTKTVQEIGKGFKQGQK